MNLTAKMGVSSFRGAAFLILEDVSQCRSQKWWMRTVIITMHMLPILWSLTLFGKALDLAGVPIESELHRSYSSSGSQDDILGFYVVAK